LSYIFTSWVTAIEKKEVVDEKCEVEIGGYFSRKAKPLTPLVVIDVFLTMV
jgi:hypothetical protein